MDKKNSKNQENKMHEKRGEKIPSGKPNEKSGKILTGPISVNSKGVGFFDLPGADGKPVRNQSKSERESLEIQPENLNRAFAGDIVEVRATGKKVRDRLQAEVVRVVSRAKTEFVGTVQKNGEMTYILPDDKRMYLDILIDPKSAEKTDVGTKVLVEIIDWGNGKENPRGKIVQTIGKAGENNTEMNAIVLEKGFRVDFPVEVLAEAEKIKSEYKKYFDEEIQNRRDMRNTLTMTIDPADAKDFDDAISFRDLNDGTFEIGVHIADVSYFVTPNTVLDTEAQKRGLSVYLVDRTIPMLPEVLSNDLCSLNPNEDKFTFSAIFKIDKNARVLDKWFGRTVIHSNKRFSYEDAQEVIDSAKNSGKEFSQSLTKLNELAKIMEKQKFGNGAINFETDEVKFVLDPSGKPISVYRKTRLDTHKLVEEYMLLANRAVAEFIFKSQNEASTATSKKQSVYRIHGKPDPERIEALAIFLKALGFDLRNVDGTVTSRDINKLLKDVEGTANEELIKTATIRSMAKAVYSTKNIGHFGLAFRYYTHFTSPIRRYPDLLVHRFLEREIKGGKIEADEYQKFENICLASSELEKKASDAERASIKYKQVEYMTGHIGQIFQGTITGVTDWGIYIEEKETKCEGMAKLRDLNDDYYVLDEKNYTIRGQKTGKKYTLGDSVTFKVITADMDKRTLDYVIV
jgi:ribonuclease R